MVAGELEQLIKTMEGFMVKIITSDGRDVRSDKGGFDYWPWKNQTKSTSTVRDFREKFSTYYRGYSIKVLLFNGESAHGSTLLSSVRESYIE